eukprot:TRINITY_DN5008_c0_g3_i2.p1 TRINITY_DN5008_c0_g3~~TRINITY_DN5008_c0_g3_i2.p1  ORF type:complete len:419 (-),score=129.94 TRINITY_DN5008_c0_g3_i2:51-1307(-)
MAADEPPGPAAGEAAPNAILHSRMHPKFLISNSTSHTWAFGAIAELIDNASDPDVCATKLAIEVETPHSHGKERLVIKDNGNGLYPEGLHRMMSFGYCDKADKVNEDGKVHQAIGKYGNGFKSGSMRIGDDAIVFTKPRSNPDQIACGLLSQTYLNSINAEEILVPIVTWNKVNLTSWTLQESDVDNMEAILQHTPWKTQEALLQYGKGHLDGHHAKRGTTIVLYNLRRQDNGKLELSFNQVNSDIMLLYQDPATIETKEVNYATPRRFQDTAMGMDFSLRQYLEVLYLKPRMKIVLLGKKVTTRLIEKELAKTSVKEYKPHASTVPVKIVLGFNVKNKNEYGMMLYHKGRLIKPFVRVGIQNMANKSGLGVIGVVAVSYTHLRAHETVLDLVCRLLLEKKKNKIQKVQNNLNVLKKR